MYTYKTRTQRRTVPPKYKRAKKRSQHQNPAEKNRRYDSAPSFWANVAAMVRSDVQQQIGAESVAKLYVS